MAWSRDTPKEQGAFLAALLSNMMMLVRYHIVSVAVRLLGACLITQLLLYDVFKAGAGRRLRFAALVGLGVIAGRLQPQEPHAGHPLGFWGRRGALPYAS